MLDLRVARPEDAHLLALDVRQDDLAEWVLASGRPLGSSLSLAIELSEGRAKTLWFGELPLCIWGVSPTNDPEVGQAWLIGTNLGQLHARRIQRYFWVALGEMHSEYPVLRCWAYSMNTFHHDWMERLGFFRTGGTMLLGLGSAYFQFQRDKET